MRRVIAWVVSLMKRRAFVLIQPWPGTDSVHALPEGVTSVGSAKYRKEITAAMQSTLADGVVLVVLNGNRGTQWSYQYLDTAQNVFDLPRALEYMAAEIRKGPSTVN